MAHKTSFRSFASSSVPLPQRIQFAVEDGRVQHALELARHLCKQDPSADNLKILRDVSFRRGQQLQKQGHLSEAIRVYMNAAEMAGTPEFQQALAERLLACGAATEAATLLARFQDPEKQTLAQGVLADQAVAKQNRALLPAQLAPQLDAVFQAFAHLEKGADEQVKAALQPIGLQSPFMEWRVLIRGLLAYYAGDDARANENWQRLDPKRLPARLAAPYRFGIDAAFRSAQSADVQNELRRQLDVLQGPSLTANLRAIQLQLGRAGSMAQAFRLIEGLLPTLRKQAPDLVPRFAACIRWAVIENGQPDDLNRYRRAIGAPADDPNLHRMTALALERNQMFDQAIQFWEAFEQDVAKSKDVWPGEQARHVRALLWAHMGKLAADEELAPDEDFDDDFDPFAPPTRKKKKQQKPKVLAAADCFRKSIELAPEVENTHEALFTYHVERGEDEAAWAVGEAFLQRFPEHAAALEGMGTLAMSAGQLDAARDFFRRALRANPLERRLRFVLGKVHEVKARELSCAKKFDEARQEIQAALSLHDTGPKHLLLCAAAMIELKDRKQARCEELVALAVKEAQHPVPIMHTMMCESIRQQAPPADKKKFAAAFQNAIVGSIEPSVIPKLVGQVWLQRLAGHPYHGQKSHEKKVLALVERATLKDYSEEVLESLCTALAELHAVRLLNRCLEVAMRRFPKNPMFFMVDADVMLRRSLNSWRIPRLLETARKLIEEMPKGERQQSLLARLEDLEKRHREQGGGYNFFASMMNRMFGDLEDDD